MKNVWFKRLLQNSVSNQILPTLYDNIGICWNSVNFSLYSQKETIIVILYRHASFSKLLNRSVSHPSRPEQEVWPHEGISEPDPPRLKDVLTSLQSYKSRGQRLTAQHGHIRANQSESESDCRKVEHDLTPTACSRQFQGRSPGSSGVD